MGNPEKRENPYYTSAPKNLNLWLQQGKRKSIAHA